VKRLIGSFLIQSRSGQIRMMPIANVRRKNQR